MRQCEVAWRRQSKERVWVSARKSGSCSLSGGEKTAFDRALGKAVEMVSDAMVVLVVPLYNIKNDVDLIGCCYRSRVRNRRMRWRNATKQVSRM